MLERPSLGSLGKPWTRDTTISRGLFFQGSQGGRSNIPTKGNFFYSIVYCDFKEHTSRSDPGTFFPGLQHVVPTFQQDIK